MYSRPLVGSLAWEDQPTSNCQDYTGWPSTFGPVVLTAWIIDDATPGFVVNHVGMSTPTTGEPFFAYTIQCDGGQTENRNINLNLDVGVDPPSLILELSTLLKTWDPKSPNLPFSVQALNTTLPDLEPIPKLSSCRP
jgi:hypothetical protein